MERRRFLQGAGLLLGGLTASFAMPKASAKPRPYGLGRRVEHDPRSWDFRHPGAKAAESVLWDHHGPVLDQGDVGSCTGNALAQFLNTDYARDLSGRREYLTEAEAVSLYSRATQLDEFPGEFPPMDTGSSGLGVCKAGVDLGFLSGYMHAFGLDHLLLALQTQPLIVGTLWTSGMFQPDINGVVHPSGYIVGGHEYLMLGADLDKERFTCLNSWSPEWGANGRFQVTFKDFEKLLISEGDVSAPIPA